MWQNDKRTQFKSTDDHYIYMYIYIYIYMYIYIENYHCLSTVGMNLVLFLFKPLILDTSHNNCNNVFSRQPWMKQKIIQILRFVFSRKYEIILRFNFLFIWQPRIRPLIRMEETIWIVNVVSFYWKVSWFHHTITNYFENFFIFEFHFGSPLLIDLSLAHYKLGSTQSLR